MNTTRKKFAALAGLASAFMTTDILMSPSISRSSRRANPSKLPLTPKQLKARAKSKAAKKARKQQYKKAKA